MKKFLSLAFMLHIGYAASIQQGNKIHVYVGGQAGLLSISGSQTNSVVNQNPLVTGYANPLTLGASAKRYSTSPQIGGICGAIWTYRNIGMSPELFFQYGHVNTRAEATRVDPGTIVGDIPDQTFKMSMRHSTTWGGALRLGYHGNAWFIYGLIGVQRTRIDTKIEELTTDRINRNGNPVEIIRIIQAIPNINGRTDWIYGVGIEKEIHKYWRIGCDIRLSQYKSIRTQTPIQFQYTGAGGLGYARYDIIDIIHTNSNHRLITVGLRVAYAFNLL